MNRRIPRRKCRAIQTFFFMLLAASPLWSQDVNTVATIPVKGSHLSNQELWLVTGYFDEFLKENYSFVHLSGSDVQTYFRTHSVPIESDLDELKNIARDLDVKMLVLTSMLITEKTARFKGSLFDARQGSITKTALEVCSCQPTNPSTFPFRKIAELLFDAPEIILSSGGQNSPELVPPAPIELPTLTAPVDTTARRSPASAPPQSQLLEKKGGFSWAKYALGALAVGAGVFYFATRKGSGEGVALEKLQDPPNPPKSGSN